MVDGMDVSLLLLGIILSKNLNWTLYIEEKAAQSVNSSLFYTRN